MKQQIYQNGFYLLLGLILGTLINIISVPKSSPRPSETTIRIDMVKNSAKVTSKDKNVKVTQVKPIAKTKVLNETNLKAEIVKNNIPHTNIVLAQAKLETVNFKADLVRTHQNIFGLKKGSRYRRYSHWTECVEDYKKCISNRYNGGSYYAFLNRIGYASHPNYTGLLKEMV